MSEIASSNRVESSNIKLSIPSEEDEAAGSNTRNNRADLNYQAGKQFVIQLNKDVPTFVLRLSICCIWVSSDKDPSWMAITYITQVASACGCKSNTGQLLGGGFIIGEEILARTRDYTA
jgi:hypothetical protein